MLARLIGRLQQNEEGFTLIELLVVVAIIALLATFAAPRLMDAINKAKKAPGQADMRTISSALERYYFDKNDYPSGSADDVKKALNGYMKSSTIYRNGFKQSYAYFAVSDGRGYVLVDPAGENGPDITITCSGTEYSARMVTGDAADLVVGATVDANKFSSCALVPGSKSTMATSL